jgi:uncharacterized UPF0160 family protein
VKMETARLVTHSGSFHADDVFAYVILRKLFPQASLVRTRDPVVLSSTDERDIVFDVGFVFDPDRRRYDHHQAAKPLRDGDPEAPYSSVGLVWRYHGRDYLRALLPDAMDRDIARLWSSIERGFILPLDLGDNGKGGPGGALSLSLAIERFAPVWDDPEQDHDGRFLRAGFMADQHLRALVAYEASKLRAEASVVDAFSGAADPRVVVLEKALPWEGVVHDHGFHEALFVVFPSMEGNWMVRCVSPACRCRMHGLDSSGRRWRQSQESKTPFSATPIGLSAPRKRANPRSPWPISPRPMASARNLRLRTVRKHFWLEFVSIIDRLQGS